MDFAAAEYYLSVVLLMSAMVGMGSTLSASDFIGVAKAPLGVVAVLIAQIAVTPLLAISLAWVLDLPPGVAFGLLLLAALPGGLYSNLLTFLGRGNVAALYCRDRRLNDSVHSQHVARPETLWRIAFTGTRHADRPDCHGDRLFSAFPAGGGNGAAASLA